MRNQTIVDFTKNQIIEGLKQLPEGNVRVFKLMYGRSRGKRSVEDAEAMTIDEVLSEISDEKLDWALSQVEASLKKQSAARGDS